MSNDFDNSKWVKARKPHQCEYCLYHIIIGETTRNVRGKYEGDMQNYYLHEECFEEITSEAYLNGGMWEFGFGDGPPPERLCPGNGRVA